jgi:hypothetical protein
MGRSGIEQMLYMMDQAFEGNRDAYRSWNALLVNLGSVREEDWYWVPPGGRRTIASLVEEIGRCKYVYASQGFGDRSMDWNNDATVPAPQVGASPTEMVAFVREAQRYLRSYIEALADDSELLKPRPAPQGGLMEARWLIKTMIEHDIYHAGEINHIRALAQGND